MINRPKIDPYERNGWFWNRTFGPLLWKYWDYNLGKHLRNGSEKCKNCIPVFNSKTMKLMRYDMTRCWYGRLIENRKSHVVQGRDPNLPPWKEPDRSNGENPRLGLSIKKKK